METKQVLTPDYVKDRYNTTIKDVYKYDYEFKRWFSTPVLQGEYVMMKKVVKRALSKIQSTPRTYLEVGPGPGTWTKYILGYFDKSILQAHLVDISKEMLHIAKHNLASFSDIHFSEADFVQFRDTKKYDFFFSSRAIEYVPDKESFINNIYDLLEVGGSGCIFTKTPKYNINRLRGKESSDFHGGQISAKDMKTLLSQKGFSDIELYPAIIKFPFVKSALLNHMLFILLGWFRLNILNNMFSESYCVTFKKKITVEFFGMPGTGKTTITRAMVEQKGFSNIKVEGRMKLLFACFHFLYKYPKRFIRLGFITLLESNSLWMFKYKFINLLLQPYAKLQEGKKYSKAIFDQCFFQSLISIFEKPITNNIFNTYIKNIDMPQKLIIFDAPLSVSMERIKDREYIVKSKKGILVFEEKIKLMKKNFDFCVDHLAGCRTDFLIVKTDRPIVDIEADIIKFLKV